MRSKAAAIIAATMAAAGFGVVMEESTPTRTVDVDSSAKPTAERIQALGGAQSVGQRVMQALLGGAARPYSGNQRPKGTGWPVAVDRRRAKAKRNRARNRAAHRG